VVGAGRQHEQYYLLRQNPLRARDGDVRLASSDDINKDRNATCAGTTAINATGSGGPIKATSVVSEAPSSWVSQHSESMEPEVDSRDAPSPTALGPIHVPFLSSSRSSAAAADANDDDADEDDDDMLAHVRKRAAATTTTASSKSKLTLSAFRRPEHTIRLTKTNPRRSLQAEYDLHSPGCRVLGHGAFSTVRLAVRRRDGVEVAIKTIAKHEALRSRRLRVGGRSDTEEWEILRRLSRHPYIINLLDVFETDEEIQLVMEYCRGGELFDAIQKKRNRAHSLNRGQYSEAQSANITSQILRALVDIHALGVVHRDVKAENILLVDSDPPEDEMLHVKLCDFGMARAVYRETDSSSDGEQSPVTPHVRQGAGRSFSIVGSNYYMAPEVGTGVSYSTSMDIYSLGVTLYILLCGFPPVFTGKEGESEVLFPNAFWKDISEDAKNLVQKMLCPEPAARISAREALADPWIVKNIVTSAKLSRRSSLVDNSAKLELVRNCLYQNLCKEGADGNKNKRAVCGQQTVARRRKRPRRASSCLMALADLYREVAAPTGLQQSSTATTGNTAVDRLQGQDSSALEPSAASFGEIVEEERRSSLVPTVPAVSV